MSVQGYSHLRDGIECQDAHRHEFEPSTGAYVLAVADGAGSRPRSAEGATLAVGIAVAALRDGLVRDGLPRDADDWRDRMREAMRTVVSAFREATTRLGAPPADFAATLTVAVLAPPWVGIASLGDGIVVAGVEPDGEEHGFHLVVFTRPAGEYVNETTFLSSSGALDHVTIRCLHDRGLTSLLLGTDGVAPIAIKRDGRVQRANASFVEPVVESLTAVRSDPTEVTRLLLEDRITRLSADDKTLLAAVRR